MTTTIPSSLSDADLLCTLRLATGEERNSTARVVSLLAEVEARRLYLGEGYRSLFVFCMRALHMSEHAAYARIEAARAARRFPTILDRLADGRLSLTTVGLLAPHLTEEDFEPLLDAASYQSKREVERLIATTHPQPDIPATIRALPMKAPASAAGQDVMLAQRQDEAPAPATMLTTLSSEAAPAAASMTKGATTRSVVAPLAPRRYLLRVTISADTERKLERARDLLRHQIPDGDPAAIIDRALTLLITQTERTKFAATKRESTARGRRSTRLGSRRIPAAVRRAVWARDQGRCAFKGHDGQCTETGFLEFHHLVPFAMGGPSAVENLELRCRAHNRHEAVLAGLAR